MALCSERSLTDILSGHITDAEIANSKFTALISAKHQHQIQVSDGENEATVAFQDTQNKKFINLCEVGSSIVFYKLEFQQDNCLIFTKKSFLKRDGAVQKKQKSITLSDLVGKGKGSLVADVLMVNIWDISNVIHLPSGRKMRKVKVGDDKHTVDLTLWSESVNLMEEFSVGDTVSMSSFSMDGYSKKSEGEPLNLNFRDREPITSLKAVTGNNIPDYLKNCKTDKQSLEIRGRIESVEDIHKYKSCPGKTDKGCGKKVADQDIFCRKESCRRKVERTTLLDDFFFNMVVFAEDGDIVLLHCFKNTLKLPVPEAMEVKDFLASIVNKSVEIRARRDKDPEREPLVETITLLD